MQPQGRPLESLWEPAILGQSQYQYGNRRNDGGQPANDDKPPHYLEDEIARERVSSRPSIPGAQDPGEPA